MSIISLTDITASYGSKGVLEHFSLDIGQGEFVMLIGTSGCGKTTALKLMNGLLKPDAGRVVVNGKDLADTDLTALRRKLGYVVQETGLFPHLTIEKNISYVADLYGKRDKKAVRERVSQLLALVELPEEVRRRYPDELSGGQKQRVALARALVNRPNIIIADEPTAALDKATADEIMEVMKSLNSIGKTIVIVTHDRTVAEKCRRIVELSDGKIISDKTIA